MFDNDKRKISVLIGNIKCHKLIKKFIESLHNLQRNTNSQLLITTSRRTNQRLIKSLKSELGRNNYIYEWSSGDKNPYLALLAMGDAIVVTGDSVSMCSEACSTGKPVYILPIKSLSYIKHLRFIKSLFKNRMARKFTKNIKNLNNTKNTLPSASDLVAEKIKELISY